MTSNARPQRDAAHRLPLEGVRIADITVVWAGPHVTQLLGEWGADIIRVEPVTTIQPYSRGAERVSTEAQYRALGAAGVTMGIPPGFDPGPDPWNRSPAFNAHARNKRSMACDVRLPEGREAFLRLIERCDVLIENNVPETIERANITYEVLREVNPKLIMLRMPAYGLDGPYKNYRGFGTHVEGMIGHHLIRTYDDGSPDEMGDAFTADAIAGVMGAWAVVAALRHRARTGQGQQVEMSLAEGFLPVIGEFIMDYTMNGRPAGQQGNRHPSHAPHGIYPTAGDDQWIAIDVATDAEYAALCQVLTSAALTDERFRTSEGRNEHRRDLEAALGEATRAHQKDALFHALQAAGVPAGPVHDDLDATRSPQLEARGFFEELTIEGVGTHRYPGIFTKWKDTPNWIRTPPVKLGEHNREIYVDLLGYSEQEYNDLCERGLVGTTYTPEVLKARD